MLRVSISHLSTDCRSRPRTSHRPQRVGGALRMVRYCMTLRCDVALCYLTRFKHPEKVKDASHQISISLEPIDGTFEQVSDCFAPAYMYRIYPYRQRDNYTPLSKPSDCAVHPRSCQSDSYAPFRGRRGGRAAVVLRICGAADTGTWRAVPSHDVVSGWLGRGRDGGRDDRGRVGFGI